MEVDDGVQNQKSAQLEINRTALEHELSQHAILSLHEEIDELKARHDQDSRDLHHRHAQHLETLKSQLDECLQQQELSTSTDSFMRQQLKESHAECGRLKSVLHTTQLHHHSEMEKLQQEVAKNLELLHQRQRDFETLKSTTDSAIHTLEEQNRTLQDETECFHRLLQFRGAGDAGESGEVVHESIVSQTLASELEVALEKTDDSTAFKRQKVRDNDEVTSLKEENRALISYIHRIVTRVMDSGEKAMSYVFQQE